jgi:hypothetical protein
VEEQSDVEDQSTVEVQQQELGDEELPDPNADVAPCGSMQGNSKLGSYVVANYEGQWFLAEVCSDQKGVGKNYTRLSYMLIKGNNNFAWGDRPDLHVALNQDIILDNVVPEPVNSRGHLGLKKKDLKIVLSRMVVVYYLPFLYFTIFRKLFEGLLATT